MNERDPRNNQRDLLRLVKLGAAFSLAGMAAFLYSLKQVHPHIRLEFTVGTVLVFILAAIVVWVICGILFKEAAAGAKPAPGQALSRLKKPAARPIILFAIAAAIGTIAAFAYAVKDISGSNLREVVQGTLMALLTLGFVAVMFWRVVRFFEEGSKIEEDKTEEDD